MNAENGFPKMYISIFCGQTNIKYICFLKSFSLVQVHHPVGEDVIYQMCYQIQILNYIVSAGC